MSSNDKKQLIIIDDDTATMSFCSKLADETNLFRQIHTFESAEKALAFLEKEQTVNNVFTGSMIVDVYMEDMDGLEFLDEIDDRELVDPATEILVLTGKNSARSREKTETSYFDATFAIKPLTRQHLIKLAGE